MRYYSYGLYGQGRGNTSGGLSGRAQALFGGLSLGEKEKGNKMETKTKRTIWDELENPSEPVEHVSELASWSMNYDYAQRPYLVFLDLIGYSSEEYGEPLTNLENLVLGYLELDLIGKALQEYATNPEMVTRYIKALEQAEENE